MMATALLLAALPAVTQVVRIGGGASTIAGTQGAAVTLYQADATTQTSVGYANGFHMGAARQVEAGNLSLTAGDSALTLALPTDLPGGTRVLTVRGALVQTLDERRAALGDTANLLPQNGTPRLSGSAFIGFTGDGYRNAYFASVTPAHAIAFAQMHLRLSSRIAVAAIGMKGTYSSMLASAAWSIQPATLAALTIGISGGKPLVQMAAHSSGQSWRVEGNYTSGALHVQPEPTLASLSLERIGWNVIANKHVRNWLWMDAARHEYATADALDAGASGIVAGRSVLYETGGTVRWRGAEAGGRILHSTSGSTRSGGYVVLAGWNAQRWSARGTFVQNTAANGITSQSASVDTTERVWTHLRLTQGTNFANGAPSFDFGGSYANRFGALMISHHETYVPFGSQAGFYRVLAIGIRLHLRDTELIADHIRGRGLRNAFDFAVDSFHGDSLGASGTPVSRMASMPRFTVRGRVTKPTGEAVRGAAVQAGTQTVFTDSEGRFLARFARADAVHVALLLRPFLPARAIAISLVSAAHSQARTTPAKRLNCRWNAVPHA